MELDLLWFISSPAEGFRGLMITLGIFMISKLFWMCIYEWKYSAGEEYLQYGKKYIKDKYMRKMP
jgi:hypothetical protein